MEKGKIAKFNEAIKSLHVKCKSTGRYFLSSSQVKP